MNFPSDLLYTKDHEWIRIEGDVATVGITDFAQSELGDIVYIEIESEGEDLDSHAIFGSIEAVKTVSDLFMPVAGTITEANEGLGDNPEVVNSDPYGEGWLIKVRMADPSATGDLLNAEDYKKLIGQ